MKILVLDTSPLENESDCSAVSSPMMRALREAGAQIEHVLTARLDLKACVGPTCMAHAFGRCFIHDDLDDLLPTMAKTDMWLLAGPVEGKGVSRISRLLARLGPDGGRLVEHYPTDSPAEDLPELKVVLLATSRTDDIDIFDALIGDVERFCFRHEKTTRRPARLSGLVLRPEAGALRQETAKDSSFARSFFSSLEEAARALVDKGSIDYDMAAKLSQDWPGTSQQAFVRSIAAALRESSG